MKYMKLYKDTCFKCSELVTNRYSTSFSLGIRMFQRKFRSPVYAIYGFVRFADEIVDSFHDFDKATLLNRFREEVNVAINEKISLNPILNAFQIVVNKYNIDRELIDAFLLSMEMDLSRENYNDQLYKTYIYGSAEVVGLMCLKIFCNGSEKEYQRLKKYACSLGSAFQKINFLRDMKSDYLERGRVYFPKVDYLNFKDWEKVEIQMDIKKDFDHAYQGIIQLPLGCRFGVYLAYKYYLTLFKKIRNVEASKVQKQRIRVPNSFKIFILLKSAIRMSVNRL